MKKLLFLVTMFLSAINIQSIGVLQTYAVNSRCINCNKYCKNTPLSKSPQYNYLGKSLFGEEPFTKKNRYGNEIIYCTCVYYPVECKKN